MTTPVLFATATRQILAIHYQNPFGECVAEFDLTEYAAQGESKKGKPSLQNVTTAQWRSVCRDILNAKTIDPDRVTNCLSMFASDYAISIFMSEFEKYARRQISRKPGCVEKNLQECLERMAARIEANRPQTLDRFAASFAPVFSLDQFAASVAA